MLDLGAHLPALLRSPVYLSREKTPDILYSVRVCRHALVGLKNIRTVQLSVGKLAVHEEFPDLVASAILEFLVGDRGQEAEGSEGTVAER